MRMSPISTWHDLIKGPCNRFLNRADQCFPLITQARRSSLFQWWVDCTTTTAGLPEAVLYMREDSCGTRSIQLVASCLKWSIAALSCCLCMLFVRDRSQDLCVFPCG